MAAEVDLELVAKLTLQDYLLEIVLAMAYAQREGGRAALVELRDQVLRGMTANVRGAMILDDEQRKEYEANAIAVTERMFKKIEARRAAFERG